MAYQHRIWLSDPTVETEIESWDSSAMENTFLLEDEPLHKSDLVAAQPSLGLNQDLIEYSYRLQKTTGKGWGLFARETIPVGKCVIVEQPALVYDHYSAAMANFGKDYSRSRNEKEWDGIEAELLQKKFEKLSNQQQKEIMLLHNCYEDSDFPALLGIIRTNVFGLSGTLRGVYILCSRFNHDCEPNCTYEFSEPQNSDDMKTLTIKITSSKHIEVGDELTIIYVPHTMGFKERQKTLAGKFGFECKCSRCVLEADKLHTFSYNEQPRARLCFRPRRLQPRVKNNRAGDFLTTIENILGTDGLEFIQKDEIILQEKPLIVLTDGDLEAKASVIYQRLLGLPGSIRNQYLGLYDWQPKTSSPSLSAVEFRGVLYEEGSIDKDGPADRGCQKPLSRETLFGIWEANNFTLEYGKEAVFSFASHFDHSCQPSCRVVWRPFKKTLDLVANGPLKTGDMITICYNYWKIYTLPFKARQKFLKKNYGFDCSCIRCCPHLRVMSDERVCVENINHLPLPEVFSPQGTAGGKTVKSPGEQIRKSAQAGKARDLKRAFDMNCQVG